MLQDGMAEESSGKRTLASLASGMRAGLQDDNDDDDDDDDDDNDDDDDDGDGDGARVEQGGRAKQVLSFGDDRVRSSKPQQQRSDGWRGAYLHPPASKHAFK